MSFSLALVVWAGFFVSVMLHEIAHGLVSEAQGDPTPRRMGRITLNPARHIDPLGLTLPILLYIIGSPVVIGWAKPVPVDPRYYPWPRFGMLLTALAGPLTNIAIATILILFAQSMPELFQFITFRQWWMRIVLINLFLAVFNLIPIPPLDGSRVLQFFLPYPVAVAYFSLERWGFLILFFLFFFVREVQLVLSKITLYLFGWLLRGLMT